MRTTVLFKTVAKHFEVLVWIFALVLLFCMSPKAGDNSLCLFRYIGFTHCPGCGIGRSIHDALHLSFISSFKHHPMGIPGVIIIFIRIKQLLYPPKQTA